MTESALNDPVAAPISTIPKGLIEPSAVTPKEPFADTANAFSTKKRMTDRTDFISWIIIIKSITQKPSAYCRGLL
ncbi:hypothetical protein B7993_07285 [Fibrobacter sp. UWH3]|nr:hypothetical protein B7993_07285 [Fibrobacter sp. UWH3]